MSLESYDVYFAGAILKDKDPEEVKRKIGAMFKLHGEQLERLFSGKPIPIKKDVDMDRAIKFRIAFRDAGGLVDIVPAGQPAPTPKPPPPARPRPAASPPAGSAPSTQEMTLAEGPMAPPSDAEVIPVTAPDYPLSSPQGFDLSDCMPEVEAAEIPDISALDLDKPGIGIDESPDPEPLEIDTSALELDTSGAILTEQSLVEPPEIDTTALSVSPAREGSLEDCQVAVEPAPIPNIDHLKIEQPERKAIKGKAQFTISQDD
ncbi:MAG: hypothetical protein KZQ88_16650 [Candidatus Thiodiazotropha sp. (ex Dulcina madagascariensis)]|nr:hypothetical protein [Candidatus Thiodiazotropha sp. (ex Epidulcina cf. delphinae)]MCU7924320.1 hypothetical protein [Candidatus Thiodiazotropha sp. (ex Dulcina madagascariensis)]MCU7927695.1 hypothetical protein [Candidatus Thiodiazotropha sp. (ex Dulcina madagascariensis)]